jgi:hypothetical protein
MPVAKYVKSVMCIIKMNIYIRHNNRKKLEDVTNSIATFFDEITPLKFYFYYKLFKVNFILEKYDRSLVYLLRYLKLNRDGDVFMSNYENLSFLFKKFLKDKFSIIQLNAFFAKKHYNLDEFLSGLFNLYNISKEMEIPVRKKFTSIHHVGKIKVSILISSYNSGSKLDFFLSNLLTNVDFKTNMYEVILIDSNSSTPDFDVIRNWLDKNKIAGSAISTINRISIQNAWNLALKCSRGDYLIFLGNDETVVSGALPFMYQYLDENPDVDWIMGQTESYKVSSENVVGEKVLDFSREKSNNLLAFLDTSQVTWVGGMYRRRLHEDLGVFNGNFTAAGDTHFKNKILPSLNYHVSQRLLGLYFEFPSPRVTESPVAEIEDLVAVDYFRNYEYVKLFLHKKEIVELNDLFAQSLGFKRSFFSHLSCDIQIASYIIKFMVEEKELNNLQKLRFALDNFWIIHVKLLSLSNLNPIKYFFYTIIYRRELMKLDKILLAKGFKSLMDKNDYYHEYAWGLW